MNFKKIATLAVIAMVLTTGMAAAIAWDTETTNTTTTSDLSGASNTVTFDPGNSSESIYVEVSGASTENLTMEMSPAQSGVNYVAYSNATPDTEDATNGHYSWTVTHKELEDVPRDLDGGTYTATVYDDTGAELLTTEVALDSSGVEDNVVLAVTDDGGSSGAAMSNLVADTLEVSQKDVGFLGVSSKYGSADKQNVSTWSGYTAVNGSNSTVQVNFENSTTADAYTSAAEGVDDGEWLTDSTVFINGVPHKVYSENAPDDLDADATTVVYKNSTDTLEINPGADYDNARNLQIRSTAGNGYGFGTLQSEFGLWAAISSLA